MITTPLLSTLGELSIVGFVPPVRPVSGVSDAPLSLRTVTLHVPPPVAPLIAAFVRPATATPGLPALAVEIRLVQSALATGPFEATSPPAPPGERETRAPA